MKNSTITAISTPIGVGGISIVRLSGKDALQIALKLTNKKQENIVPRHLHLTKIKTTNFLEQGLMVYFKAPNSYTGENMVEFQCHGGIVIANGILDELLKNGAQLAQDGEFTKRAFLNGKLTLEKAEGIIDMINAESEAQVRAGYNLLSGELYQKVKNMQNNLTNVIAEMEVAIDYPEHDIEYETIEKFNNYLLSTKNQIEQLLKTVSTGKLVKNGITVAILGKPNVGKSSLMNALLNYDRAIVTEIAGTTRDTLEENYNYKGVHINLIDTAGVRENVSDKVEKLGIERTYKTLNYADIILVVLDGSEKLSIEDEKNLHITKNKNQIIVQNKIDKNATPIISDNNLILVSAEKKQNIDLLKETIYNKVIDSSIMESSVIITNKRHAEALKQALINIEDALLSIANAMSLDLVALDVQNAWKTLGEITGESSTEEIIDAIFTKFCLGK
ncbi:MAG: tRNA uridine-5-carboxymethylaminomethyl(34) synthesis GTPase MnmE [Tenericutes bacterium HGW-Tenericutes-4]|jgi:tRNA modification GTPase|nr:MAG: tRNA uridine-5-carboxymethylaminomethyl(34) synthesis GTPase MnmE [Tenericutes bacterium HGW-Tenericutes-4]